MQERRYITFGGVNSLTDLGVMIDSELTQLDPPEPRYLYDKVPYHDGAYNASTVGGRMFYEPVSLTYVFTLHAADRGALTELKRQVVNAFSGVVGDLTDSDIPGEKYTNAMMIGVPTVEFVSRAFMNARMTVRFTADPYMQSINGSRTRVYKFSAVGDVSLYIAANSVIFMPAWTAEPVTVGSGVLIELPEGVTSAAQKGFHLAGIAADAEVASAVVTREGSALRDITMKNSSDGVFLGSTGDTLQITYAGDVSPTGFTCGDVKTTYTVGAPYTYRLEAYTEGTPTVKLNGAAIDTAQKFTMPDTALLAIQNTGYGYYELWHDTLEVRL